MVSSTSVLLVAVEGTKVIGLLKGDAEVIMASFPALNEIVINFYKKMGFRPVEYLFAKEA